MQEYFKTRLFFIFISIAASLHGAMRMDGGILWFLSFIVLAANIYLGESFLRSGF